MKTIINENTRCHASNQDLNTESSVIKAGVTENTNDTKMIPNDAIAGINKEDCIDEINIIDLTISKNDEKNESHTEVQNSTMKAMSNMSLHNSVINLNGNTNDLQLPSIVHERNEYDFELNRDSNILIQNGQNKNTRLTIAGNDIKDFGPTNVRDINLIGNNNIQSPSIINERNGYGTGWNCDDSIIVQNEQNKNTRFPFAQNSITDFEIPNVMDNIYNQIDNTIQSPSLINERNGYGIGLNCDSPILIQNYQNQNTYSTIAENNIRGFKVTNVIENNSNQIGNNSNQNIQKLFGIGDKNIENKQNLIIKDGKTCKCLKNDNDNINVITSKVNDKKDKKEANVKNSKRKPKEKTVRTTKAIKSTDSENTQKINKTRKKKGEITKKNSKRSIKTNVLNTFDSNNNSAKNNVLPGLDKEKERKEDLSWIENLKYIREVSKEEYDSTNIIEETFWNDLSLAVDFNLNDFDYID